MIFHSSLAKMQSTFTFVFLFLSSTLILAAQQEYESNPLLPIIPSVDGSVKVTLIYPESGMARPNVKRNFIFGSVGTAKAVLTINGDTVPVAPNGAFLGFLPLPKDGVYTLIAEQGEERDTLLYTFSTPTPGVRSPRVRNLYEKPKLGIVTKGVDTLASGSDIAYGAPTKTADRQWFFPIGARFPVYERDGDHVRIDLAGETAWVEREYITTSSAEPETSEVNLDIDVADAEQWVDLTMQVGYAPFRIDPQEKSVTFTFYNALSFDLENEIDKTSETGYTVSNLPNYLVEGYHWSGDDEKAIVTLRIDLRRKLWGFKAFYDESGQLVLRLRRPNAISAENPLRGLIIMVDAGHPPRGASGPTGLSEADANLAIALELEKQLKAKGAQVLMTRRDENPLLTDTNATMELSARVAYAVRHNADILISIHNNGFSDGVNPWEKNGTETYYYHAFSSDLARALQEEIVEVTNVPSLGYKQRSLSLTRPTWMPAVLTESLYMMHPQQEQALRDPQFLEKLAAAHVRGIERFVRGMVGGS